MNVKNLIKKNQLMITALAIMIAIAGYLQFAGSGMEDEYLKTDDSNVEASNASPVDSEGVVTENYTLDGLLDLSPHRTGPGRSPRWCGSRCRSRPPGR